MEKIQATSSLKKPYVYNRRNNIMKQCNILVRFDSPQEKQDVIPSIINFVYDLPRNLPNNRTLKTLGN